MPRKARRGRKPPQRRTTDVEAAFERERRQRERCRAKQWFDTEAEARTIAAMHRARYGEISAPYHCDLCGGWHLSSRRPLEGR